MNDLNYVAFILGADVAHDKLYAKLEYTDEVYEECKRLAQEFLHSAYNKDTKSLYDCVQEYARDNI